MSSTDLTDEAIIAGGPDFVKDDNLLQLAAKYSHVEIAEKLNAGKYEPVIDALRIRKRLHEAIKRISKRDDRGHDDIKAELDAARKQNGVKARGTEQSRKKAVETVKMKKARQTPTTAPGDGVDDEEMAVADGEEGDSGEVEEPEVVTPARSAPAPRKRKSFKLPLFQPAKPKVTQAQRNADQNETVEPVEVDAEMQDAATTLLQMFKQEEAAGALLQLLPGETTVNEEADAADSESDDPTVVRKVRIYFLGKQITRRVYLHFTKPTDPETYEKAKEQAEKDYDLENELRELEVHGLFEDQGVMMDDDVVQLAKLYTIPEIVDHLNAGSTDTVHTKKTVERRIDSALNSVCTRKGKDFRRFCEAFRNDRAELGTTARERQRKRRSK